MADEVNATTRYILETARERDIFEQHARAMHAAIRAFRKLDMLGPLGDLRATEEYDNLCLTWKAFDEQINVRSYKDKMPDRVKPSERKHTPDTGWK